MAARTLTRQQHRVLEHIANTGDTVVMTAAALGVTGQTVKNHLSGAYGKLGVHSITGAFVARGWLDVGTHRHVWTCSCGATRR